MKSKLLIISLFFWVSSFAQSVPNTNTFSLQNVVDVTGGSSLSAAFSNSIDSYFDSNYKGSKDRLSNFRNYHVLSASYAWIMGGESTWNESAEDACGNFNPSTGVVTLYSSDNTLNYSTTFYTDAALTTPADLPTDGYYVGLCLASDKSTRYTVKWVEGIINDIVSCSYVVSYAFIASYSSMMVSPDYGSVSVTTMADNYTYTLIAEDSWITPSVSTTSGNDSFTISVSQNLTGLQRYSRVRVMLGDVFVDNIEISQDTY